MAKIIRVQRAKKAVVRSVPKKSAKAKVKAKPARAEKKAVKPKAPKFKASKPKGAKPWTQEEIREAFERFRKANPDPRGELEHLNPYTLLVAVVLSAQATDAGVNKATRELFRVADTPQKMLALGEEKLRDYIKTIGLYRNKAKNVIALSDKLIRDFGGEVPRTPAARLQTSCSTWLMASTPWPSIRMSFVLPTAPVWRQARRRSKSSLGSRK